MQVFLPSLLIWINYKDKWQSTQIIIRKDDAGAGLHGANLLTKLTDICCYNIWLLLEVPTPACLRILYYWDTWANTERNAFRMEWTLECWWSWRMMASPNQWTLTYPSGFPSITRVGCFKTMFVHKTEMATICFNALFKPLKETIPNSSFFPKLFSAYAVE